MALYSLIVLTCR